MPVPRRNRVLTAVRRMIIGKSRNAGSTTILSGVETSLFCARCGQGVHSQLRTHHDRRPSKFIVLADSIKSAINTAWEHGGAGFQSRFDKSTAQAQEMKEGALRVL